MSNDERIIFTQEQIAMLEGRRELDLKMMAFMEASIIDREDIRKQVGGLELTLSGNTYMLDKMHTALFAKTDDNEFGTAGLMVSMQKVLKHMEVVCNLAHAAKWAIVSILGVVTPTLAALHYLKVI